MTELLLYLYAESPVHAGGADSLGALDLPVQREASTRYPVIWGQSLKGALRQAAGEAKWPTDMITEVFGSVIGVGRDETVVDPSDTRGATTAGQLAVGDAQLVAMPVPTLQNTFAWVTSELALARLSRKYINLSGDLPSPPAIPRVGADRGAAAGASWVQRTGSQSEVLGPCLVQLGDVPDPQLVEWSGRLAGDVLGGEVCFGQLADKLRDDLLVVGATIMPMLLVECTEFVARVQLSGDKTVENGPFYSEYLPAETILACSLSLRRSSKDPQGARQAEHADKLRDLLDGHLIKVGGDETIGKGMVWARLLGGGQ